jgi:hypothetical protein
MLTSCAVYFVFLAGMFYTNTTMDKGKYMKEFNDLLTEKQKKKYNSIKLERLEIYIKGYMYGLLISLYLMTKINDMTLRICTIGAVTMLTNYFYYMLSKKSDYMILHLDDKEKREKWLAIYKHMQRRYHMGLLFGVLSVMGLGMKL